MTLLIPPDYGRTPGLTRLRQERRRAQGEACARHGRDFRPPGKKEVSFLFARSGLVLSIDYPDPVQLNKALWENIKRRS